MLKTTTVYFFHSNKNKILKEKLAFVLFSNFSFHSFFRTSHIQSIKYFASWTFKRYFEYDFSLTAPLQAESRSLTKSLEECRETQGMEHRGRSKHCPIWERKDNFYSICPGLFSETQCSHCMLKTTMDLKRRRAVTGLRDALGIWLRNLILTEELSQLEAVPLRKEDQEINILNWLTSPPQFPVPHWLSPTWNRLSTEPIDMVHRDHSDTE